MTMDTDALLITVQSHGARFFSIAKQYPDAPIPACPDWKMSNLVGHVGVIYGGIGDLLKAGITDRPSTPFPTPPNRDLHGWAQNNLYTMLDLFASREPEHPIWTWGKEQTVGWLARRMTHETLVHMWDAETVTSEHLPVDSDLANDGIDEFIEGPLQFSSNLNRKFSYPTGSLHLHRTDGEGEWLLEPSSDGLTVAHVHAKGDVAVRGTSMKLLLYLWGRHPEDLQIFGDEKLAVEWGNQAP